MLVLLSLECNTRRLSFVVGRYDETTCYTEMHGGVDSNCPWAKKIW